MKKILLSAVLFAATVSCSTPKYNYYFDRYSTKRPNSAKAMDADVENKSSNPAAEITVFNSLSSIQEEALVASTSKENFVLPNHKALLADRRPKTSVSEITKTGKGLVNVVNELKNKKKISPESVKEGDKSKNGSAVLGFTLVALSPIVGILITLAAPGVGIGIAVGAFGFVIGMICCIIGLKSEKRRLAKTGITIGIIEFVLGIALVIIAIGLASSIR